MLRKPGILLFASESCFVRGSNNLTGGMLEDIYQAARGYLMNYSVHYCGPTFLGDHASLHMSLGLGRLIVSVVLPLQ